MDSLLICLKKNKITFPPEAKHVGHPCSQFVFIVWLAAALFSPFCICKHSKNVEIQQNFTHPHAHSHSHISVHLLIHTHTYRHTYT